MDLRAISHLCVSWTDLKLPTVIQGLCPPPSTQRSLGEDQVYYLMGAGGALSISPTCLDVLIQLVYEGIQLLAVLRLQLQSITGMDPLAQGAGSPRQP